MDRRAMWTLLLLLAPGVARGQVAGEAVPDPALDPVSRSFLFPRRELSRTPADFGLEARDAAFAAAGGVRLAGWFFDQPASDATVLVCGGNVDNRSLLLPYARLLVDQGFDVLVFDWQGFGDSGGVAALGSLYGDALAAFDWLIVHQGRAPGRIGVLGISLGSVLALAVGAQRQPAAVAVESAFLPAEQVAAVRDRFTGRAERFALEALERAVLPTVDPFRNAAAYRGPLFLLHGELDRLLPPAGTVRLAEAVGDRARVWLMDDVGHAPEPLVANDLEYAEQLGRFFREAFAGGAPAAEPIGWFATRFGDGRFDVRVEVRRSGSVPVQIACSDGEQFHFERRFAGFHEGPQVVTVPFRPTHVSVLEFHHVQDLGDTWVPTLSARCDSYRRWQELVAGLAGQPAASVVRSDDGRVEWLSLDESHWDWLRARLPGKGSIHPEIRPRYARLLAALAERLHAAGSPRAAEVEAVVPDFLSEEPERYFELGNARFEQGYRDRATRAALWHLARVRQKAEDLEGMRAALRQLLRHSWDVVPALRESDVEFVGLKSDLAAWAPAD